MHHSGAHLVSVGYALAPEHKFPEGLEDAYAATCWAAQNAASYGADPDCIAVAGECTGSEACFLTYFHMLTAKHMPPPAGHTNTLP